MRACHESFEAMPGDGRERFCDKCEKRVHDLSSRTEEEARALMKDAARRGERVCVRFAKTPDGAVRFRSPALRAVGRGSAADLRGVGLAAALSLAACTAPVDQPPPKADPAAQPGDPAAQPAEEVDMGDAIPDEADRCPDQPDPNDPLGDDGCPERDETKR